MPTSPTTVGSAVHFVTDVGHTGLGVFGWVDNANFKGEADLTEIRDNANYVRTRIYSNHTRTATLRVVPSGSNSINALTHPGATCTLTSPNGTFLAGTGSFDITGYEVDKSVGQAGTVVWNLKEYAYPTG